MTFITNITKQDLLNMIGERLKMFALPNVHQEYTQLAETIRNEFDDSKPIEISFEGSGQNARAILIGVVLQGLYCKMKGNRQTE